MVLGFFFLNCHKTSKYLNSPDLDVFRKHLKQNFMNLVFLKSFLEIFYIYNGLFDKIFSPQSHWTLTKSQITFGKVIQTFFSPLWS